MHTLVQTHKHTYTHTRKFWGQRHSTDITFNTRSGRQSDCAPVDPGSRHEGMTASFSWQKASGGKQMQSLGPPGDAWLCDLEWGPVIEEDQHLEAFQGLPTVFAEARDVGQKTL